eukprot:566455-Pyramimonas_sp.AAC.1
MSRGVSDDNTVERHAMSTSTQALPSWLDLISTSGCASYSRYNVEGYDRQGIIKVATQFIFEDLTTSAVPAPLDTDVIHDVPRELSELVGRTWNAPFDRIPTYERWGRMLLA